MSWTPPPPPLANRDSIVAYWLALLEIPADEPSAAILQEMATDRLTELRAMPDDNANRLPGW